VSAAGRLALFWFAGLVALTAYYQILLGFQSAAAPWLVARDVLASDLGRVLTHITVPVLLAFLLSVASGLWRRSGPILLRALAAVSCVAVPLAGLLLCRAFDPVIAEILSQP